DDLLPTSFVQPFVENEILRILVLAILVAASISMLAERQRKPILAVFEAASKVIFGMIRLIMWVAPLGAFGGMAYTISVFGAASLQAFGGTFFNAESIAVGIALVVGIDRIMSEGRALTNAIGNSVATMVIAKWQGERDEERFQEVLRNPSIIDREVERAMLGA